MSDYRSGLKCLVKLGLFADAQEIIGQGSMSNEKVNNLIPVNNKSTGEWSLYLEGESAERAENFTVTFDTNTSENFLTLYAATKVNTSVELTFMLGDITDAGTEYIEGKFMVTTSGGAMDKGAIQQMTFSFMSQGQPTYGVIA